MSPTTTEAKLEEELALAKENLDEVKAYIRVVKNELEKLCTKQIEHQVSYDHKAEELRVFRAMYPSMCRRTKE